MDEECRNEVPKHPRNAWIFFYQEQCKLKDDNSLKPMSMEEISEKWKALGDHAKRKYKKKSIKSSEKYKEHKIKLDLPKAPKNTFISRTQLKAAYGRMQELNPLQVESVKAMGFGGILQLKCTKLDRSLCEWLVQHFDPVSLCLHVHGKDCIITPLDVNHILGLPCGGQRVILEGEYTEIHELCLRHKVGDQGSISFDHLHNYLMKSKKDDDDFKVSFVLYIMGTILCPTSEFAVNKRFLHALKDLSSVRELDWSQFVLKFLAEGIQKYQKGRKVIRGCLLFLMLFYLEHCTPAEYFTSRCGMRPSPRLSTWGDKDIRERVRWFNKTRKRKGEKVKVIIEDGVGKRERMMNQGKEVDHDKSMENDQVKNLTSMVERMSSLLEETLATMHEKDRKRKYSGTNGGINKKDNPSALEEPDVGGHFETKKAKFTENALSDQMTSPLKTNKEKGKEEIKLNASSNRLRKMAANVREALSRTAPAIDGKNKWEKKLKTNRFDKSQPLKRNANKKSTMEAESRRADVMATLSNEKQLIVRYVFDHTQSEREILCDLGIEHLNRHDFFSARPNEWIESGLINLVALKKTLLQKKRYPNGLWPAWYLPTYFSNYALRGGLNAKSWAKQYTGTHRYTGEPQACERVYIPINDSDSHWFMCVVNIRHGIVYILDSLPSPTENKRRAELVTRVVKYLDDLFQYLDVPQVKKFSMLPFERLKWLPIQEAADCGVHTAKYFNLEQFIQDELIMLKFSSAEGRIGLVLDLIMFEGNNVKEKIMEKAKKKYPSPKGKN